LLRKPPSHTTPLGVTPCCPALCRLIPAAAKPGPWELRKRKPAPEPTAAPEPPTAQPSDPQQRQQLSDQPPPSLQQQQQLPDQPPPSLQQLEWDKQQGDASSGENSGEASNGDATCPQGGAPLSLEDRLLLLLAHRAAMEREVLCVQSQLLLLNPMHCAQPLEPMQPMHSAQPLKPMHSAQPLKPMQPMHSAQPLKPMQPMHNASLWPHDDRLPPQLAHRLPEQQQQQWQQLEVEGGGGGGGERQQQLAHRLPELSRLHGLHAQQGLEEEQGQQQLQQQALREEEDGAPCTGGHAQQATFSPLATRSPLSTLGLGLRVEG
jgi:hypothetical protein